MSVNPTKTDREIWRQPDGDLLINVHPGSECAERPCILHNPTPHKMREWRINHRETGLIERLCAHGVGHPDPDSVWFLENIKGWGGYDVHGCDGCCQ